MTVVPPRLPPLRHRPIGFAHRGAKAHERENTIAAFELALKLGATGLETDVWLTRDGEAVLHHDEDVGRRPFRKPIAGLDRRELPPHVPTLTDLFDACGTDYDLSIDLKEPEAVHAVLEAARDRFPLDRLWLCFWEFERLASWRELDGSVRLVDSCKLETMELGPERRAADLAAAGIDAVNLRVREWTGGLVALFHRFEVHAFAWDVQHRHELAQTLDMGIDAVYSDHVDRMSDAIAAIWPD